VCRRLLQQLSQPGDPRVAVEQRVPLHCFHDPGELDWRLDSPDRQDARIVLRQSTMEGRNSPRIDHVQRDGIERSRDHLDAARMTMVSEVPLFRHRRAAPIELADDVTELERLLQSERLADSVVPGPGVAGVADAEPRTGRPRGRDVARAAAVVTR